MKEASGYEDGHQVISCDFPVGPHGANLTLNDVEILGDLLAGHRIHRNAVSSEGMRRRMNLKQNSG